MKYRLKPNMPKAKYKTLYGGVTYEFDTETFREYPKALVSMFLASLESEPKPKKTEIQSEE